MGKSELNRDVAMILAGAKAYQNCTDVGIGAACGVSAGTIRNKRMKAELHKLSYEKVALLAELAGGRIEFVKGKK